MATKILSANNPLIDVDDPQQTLSNAKHVIWYVSLTAPDLIDQGGNEEASSGLAMILECAAQAVDHVIRATTARKGGAA
jgi:hypothetical protein